MERWSRVGSRGAESREGIVYLECLSSSYTLKRAYEIYRSEGGQCTGLSDIPEYGRCETSGSMYPMTRFNNRVGHIGSLDRDDTKSCLCLRPRILESVQVLSETLFEELVPRLSKGLLWSLPSLILMEGVWREHGQHTRLSSRLAELMERLSGVYAEGTPVSVHTPFSIAEYECEDNKQGLLRLPRLSVVAILSGLHGTLHNNQLVDNHPEDVEYEAIAASRLPVNYETGFLCCSYTAHSQEAGKVRLVARGVSVRVMTQQLVYRLCCALTTVVTKGGDWILSCMGLFCEVSEDTIESLRESLRLVFEDYSNRPTLHVSRRTRTISVSLSSGVLLKSVPHYDSLDSHSVTLEHGNNRIGIAGLSDSIESLTSTFYSLVPYVDKDRPPRTLIAATQANQAIAAPFTGQGNTAVPCYASLPLVQTKLMSSVVRECIASPSKVWPIPGMEMTVCIANFNDNYEDCFMVSKSLADRGCFMTSCTTSHKSRDNEVIPDRGHKADTQTNRWWKADDKGTVLTITLASGGERSVRVHRVSQLVSGDKLSTHHGQKGVCKLVREEDMPWGVNTRGDIVSFDLVIALSSIVNRVTLGQYYEVREAMRLLCGNSDRTLDLSCEAVLYDGRTGEVITKTDTNGSVVPVKASYGVARF